MKNSKKFSISQLFYNNKFLLIFSVVAAFVLWLVITLQQNPTRTRTFSDITVNISTENTVVSDLGLDIISGGVGEKVNVTVSGPNYIVSSLEAGDILVTASLANVSNAGKYDLTLNATQNGTAAGYSIVSITPATIPVTFDYIDTKEFAVSADAEGAVAVEGLVVDTPVVADSEFKVVSIKGPRTEMEKISKVVAVAKVDKTLAETEAFDADVKLYDANGVEIDSSVFTLSANQVKISVPIAKKAVLPISATFENAPSGFANVKYTLSQTSVTVLGPEETVAKLKSIPLAAIDVSKLSVANTSFDVGLALPDGVRALDNIDSVNVKFNLSGYTEKTFNVSNIKYSNVAAGLKPAASSSVKNVKICGPSKVLKKLDNADFYAQIDLSGKKAGEYTMPVKIMCSSENGVWQVGEYSVIITVK